MKSLTLYFAGSHYPFPLENRLVSYAYPEQINTWFKMTGTMFGRIIVDSGAFSAWKTGKVINIQDFAKYAHNAIERGKAFNKEVRVVNLDVIPGSVGKTKALNKLLSGTRKQNLELIDEAARAGYKNMLTMISLGIKPIHVFHQGEKWKWLDRMVEQVPYIGVSPANDMPPKSKHEWMYSVFSYLYKNNMNVDTHGFAVFNKESIEEFPWTSCDAASALLLAGYGKVYCPVGGFLNPDYSQKPSHLVVSGREVVIQTEGGITQEVLTKKASNGSRDVTDEKLTRLFGYTFDDLQKLEVRMRLNCDYIIGFQNYINEKRTFIEFKPKQTLL